MLDQQFDLVKVASEIVKRIYLIIGFVALSGLTVLAVTSTDGMVRRLGGMRWARLHQIVYVIAFLALIHYFQQTKADVSVPTLVAGLFGWLMCYRFAVRRIRGELSSAGLALLSVVVAALTLIVQALGVAHRVPRLAAHGHATAFTFYFDVDTEGTLSETLQSLVDNISHAQPGLAGARRGADRRCRQRGLRALRQAAPRSRQGRRGAAKLDCAGAGFGELISRFRDNVVVIPGPPSGEPGIQHLRNRRFLDSGFALTRAPE